MLKEAISCLIGSVALLALIPTEWAAYRAALKGAFKRRDLMTYFSLALLSMFVASAGFEAELVFSFRTFSWPGKGLPFLVLIPFILLTFALVDLHAAKISRARNWLVAGTVASTGSIWILFYLAMQLRVLQ